MIYIVMQDFPLYSRRFRQGDLFDAEYWGKKLTEGLVANGRIEHIIVYEEEEDDELDYEPIDSADISDEYASRVSEPYS